MKLLGRIAVGASLFVVAVLVFRTTVRADSPPDQTWDYVRVVGVASDQLSLDVEVAPFEGCNAPQKVDASKPCPQLHLVVKDMVVKDRVKQLHTGDRIKITFAFGENNQNPLKVFCLDVAQSREGSLDAPTRFTRTWVLLASALLCLLFYCCFTGFKPNQLMIGADNRYSNSKFQITLWFFVLITTYVATLWLRVWFAGCEFIGGVNIPDNLLMLSGLSVLTFGGAKAITVSKVNAQKAVGNIDPKQQLGAKPHFLWDLTHNDGTPAVPAKPAIPAQAAVGDQPAVAAQNAVPAQPATLPQLDFGDFQMLVLTLIAVATYLVLVFHFLGTIETSKVISLPDVDTTILAAVGLGHGAYLTKKAVGDVGQT